MSEWLLILIAGAIGGLVNTFLSEGGFAAPFTFTDARGHTRWHPGTAGDVVVGAVAGIVFWGLYTPDPSFTSPATVRPVVGSLLAGLGGGRVLAGYLDRFLNEASLRRASNTMNRTFDVELDADREERHDVRSRENGD